MHPIRQRRGFTLIELLVVVSIIMLLLSILLPSLRRAREKVKDTQCLTRLRSIATGFMLYANADKRLPPLNNDVDEGAWQYNYLIFDGRDFEQNFGQLIKRKFVPDIRQFYCPVQEDPFHTLSAPFNPWPVVPGNDTRAGYARRHGLSGKDFTQFRKTKAFVADLIHHPKYIERTGHKTGLNVVYTDGHGIWVNAEDELTDNDLAAPFDPADNPVVQSIWHLLDRKGR